MRPRTAWRPEPAEGRGLLVAKDNGYRGPTMQTVYAAYLKTVWHMGHRIKHQRSACACGSLNGLQKS
jgi:hypothetical protein